MGRRDNASEPKYNQGEIVLVGFYPKATGIRKESTFRDGHLVRFLKKRD